MTIKNDDSIFYVPVKAMVLVIFESVGNETNMFIIPSDHPVAAAARKSDGKYINNSKLEDDDPIFALDEFLYTDEGKYMKITTPYTGEKGVITEIVKCGHIL